MRRFATTIILLIAAVLNACSSGSEATYQLTVESNDPAVIEDTNQILLARFQRVLPYPVSTIDSEVSGSYVSYTFRGGAPDDSIVKYLCHTIGHFSMSLSDQDSDKSLVTALDIESASAGFDSSGPIILIQLSEEAGERVRLLTSQNLGKVVTAKMDNATLIEAIIRGEFAGIFQVTAPSDADTYAVAAILEAGPLPVPVELRGLKDGA